MPGCILLDILQELKFGDWDTRTVLAAQTSRGDAGEEMWGRPGHRGRPLNVAAPFLNRIPASGQPLAVVSRTCVSWQSARHYFNCWGCVFTAFCNTVLIYLWMASAALSRSHTMDDTIAQRSSSFCILASRQVTQAARDDREAPS